MHIVNLLNSIGVTLTSTSAGAIFGKIQSSLDVKKTILSMKDVMKYDLIDLFGYQESEASPLHVKYVMESKWNRVILSVMVPDTQRIESISCIFPIANWLERETYDLFGIVFEDHPKLSKIFLDSMNNFFPLRKGESYIKSKMIYSDVRSEFVNVREDEAKESANYEDFFHELESNVLTIPISIKGGNKTFFDKEISVDIGLTHKGIEKDSENISLSSINTKTSGHGWCTKLPKLIANFVCIDQMLSNSTPIGKLSRLIAAGFAEIDRAINHIVNIATLSTIQSSLNQDIAIYETLFSTIRIFESTINVDGPVGKILSFSEYSSSTLKEAAEIGINIANFLAPLIEFSKNLIFAANKFELGSDNFHNLSNNQLILDTIKTNGGPISRSMGYKNDIRADVPYCGYSSYRIRFFSVANKKLNPCLQRYFMRVVEANDSLIMAAFILKSAMAESQLLSKNKAQKPQLPVLVESYATIESPRGCFGVYMSADGNGNIIRYRMRSPSFFWMQCLPLILSETNKKDLPLILNSFDLSAHEADR